MEVARTFRARHGNDLALEVALKDAPSTLVDHERCLALASGILVGLRDDPRWCIGDALVD